jgi:hypothetical protein
MCCSRQSGKSTVTALLASHTARYYPGNLILLVSRSLRQSSELFRKVGAFLGQSRDHTEKMVENNRLSCELSNGSRVVSLPASEETIRGFSGATLLICDEAARCSDALYYSVRPMLAVSGGRLALLSTPWGKCGFFYDTWENGGERWERVQVRATECPRISPEFLQEERDTMPARWFAQEYECSFEEVEDSVFAYDDVQAALTDDVPALRI